MARKTAYCFSPVTGEYLGAEAAQPSPLEVDTYLLPANATFKEPPCANTGETAVWSGGGWTIKRDWRDGEHRLPDETRHKIAAIDEGQPDGALDAPPPRAFDAVKGQALAAIKAEHARALNESTRHATPEERDTWIVKAEAARAWSNSSATKAQIGLLTSEADAAGETAQELAARIGNRHEAYLSLIGAAAGARRRAEKRVQACRSAAEVESALAAFSEETRIAITTWRER